MGFADLSLCRAHTHCVVFQAMAHFEIVLKACSIITAR